MSSGVDRIERSAKRGMWRAACLALYASQDDPHRPSKCAPMIAATGLSFCAMGSGSTLNASIVVAPIRYRESFVPNKTWQISVSPNSGRVIAACPSSRRSLRLSARMTSRVSAGSIPISCSRSSGMSVYIDPVSTQKSSSKYLFGSAGFVTRALTLNMPIFVSFNLSSRKRFTGKRKGSQPTGRAQEPERIASSRRALCALRLKTWSK